MHRLSTTKIPIWIFKSRVDPRSLKWEIHRMTPNWILTLNSQMNSTYTKYLLNTEVHIFVRFALRLAFSEIQGCQKSEMHWVTLNWTWTLNSQRYSIYCGVWRVCWCVRVSSCVWSPKSRGLFWSVISWTVLSLARPSPPHPPRLPLLQSILQRRIRSTVGAAIRSQLSSLRDPTPGVRLRSVPVRLVRLSTWPTLPSRNPAFPCQLRVLSGLPASWIP